MKFPFRLLLFIFCAGFISLLLAEELLPEVQTPAPAETETQTQALPETEIPTRVLPETEVQTRVLPETEMKTQTQAPSERENRVKLTFGILTDSETAGDSQETGIWKPGRWVPVCISLPAALLPDGTSESASDSASERRFCGKILLETSDPDGTPTVSEHEIDVTLPASVEFRARFGRTAGNYSLKIYRKETEKGFQPVFETSGTVTEPLEEPKGLILIVGKSLAGVDAGVSQMACPGEYRPRTVRLASARNLPQDPAAWELLDVLVVTTDDSDVLSTWKAREIARLSQWVQHGGTLVISLGKNAEAFAQNPLWKPFLPGKLEKVIPVRETSSLELFAQSPLPVSLLGVTEKHRISVAKFTEIPSEIQIRAAQYDLPLVLRRRMGLGQIHWAAFDLEHPAIAGWGGRGNFIAALLEFAKYNNDAEETVRRGMRNGYNDLAGQLRSALDAFSGLRSISFGVLVTFFILYLAAIGPGCWFLCKKLPYGGEAASWSVFFLTVAGGCTVLFHLADSSTGGVRMNRIHVTDFVQETNSVRELEWGNVWSPDAARLTLEIPPFALPESCKISQNSQETSDSQNASDSQKISSVSLNKNTKITQADASTEVSEVQTAWFGLPGSYLGGMDSRVSTAVGVISGSETAYKMEETKLENVPFFARSTKSFTSKRWVSLSEETFPQFGNLHENPYARVLGEIRNPFSVPLVRCLLFYGEWAYEIGRLEPGQTFTIDETTSYLGAAALLVDADYIEDHSIKSSVGMRRVNRPYDRTSRSPEYVMRNMLFYTKAGGRSYAGQHNRYQHFLDCSPLLECHTAVLYGVAESENPTSKENENGFHSCFHNGFLLRDAVSGTEIPFENPDDKNVQIIRGFIPVKVPSRSGEGDGSD